MTLLFFFRRCFTISDKTRINEKIRVKEVRLIGVDGEQLGVLPTREALEMAIEKKLDLVEVAGNAVPPVCRIMDFGKFRYEKEKKAKEAKKKQTKIVVKEIKFKPRIDKHDLETKITKIEKFLEKGNKVKVSLMLFGRERMHTDIGIQVLELVAERLEDKAVVEKKYKEAQKFLMLSSK
jgi:translation initiation factor IF-3